MAHSKKIKAECMAALLEGQSVALVAEQYELPATTVSRWGKIARLEAGEEEEIGDMLLDNLRGNIGARNAIFETFLDEGWRKEQSASELGVALGILDDKCHRLLSAMSHPPVERNYTDSEKKRRHNHG